MKRSWPLVALLFTACLPIEPAQLHQTVFEHTFDGDSTQPRLHLRTVPEVRSVSIATFNLKVLGPSKSGRPDLVQALAKVITSYDLIAVQEIKDISEQAPYVLADAVRALSANHQMVLGPRSGLQPDDRNSQEQYAYFYDATLIASLGPGEVFDDQMHDLFQREPFVASFQVRHGGPSLALINIHTRPAAAVQEIAALDVVFDWTRARNLNVDAVIALGDFNAGCSYASPEELDALQIRDERYVWAIPDDADTNFATSNCAYDRVVFEAQSAGWWQGHWGVDRAFDDVSVSDHWPVWVELAW